jgi:hypothetical protein
VGTETGDWKATRAGSRLQDMNNLEEMARADILRLANHPAEV